MNVQMEYNIKNKALIIEKITDNLKVKEYIKFAYIFGSFAQIDENSIYEKYYNDIDIAIYSEIKNKDSLSLELEIENELENIIHIPVDGRIINDTPLSFQYNVIKTSIVIVDQDKNLRSDFEGLVFKKYFDFVHLRNEYLKEVI